jgi:histidine phosphotransfer protein HptB
LSRRPQVPWQGSDNLPMDGTPEADPRTAPLLDSAAIERLRELDPSGSQGIVQRVLRAYENALLRQLDELAVAEAAREWERVSRIAHTLKSSSASVGALSLSRRCAEVERLLRVQPGEPLGPRLEELIHEARQVLVAVRAMLPP